MAKVLTFEPPKLYRYRSLDCPIKLNRETAALQQAHLYCSKFTDLNDPMEGSYKFHYPQSYFRQLISRRLFNNKEALGICSFSETNDNAMMWAHYADQFRGICVEYDFEKLRSSLSDDNIFVRVSYSESAIELSPGALSDAITARKLLSSKSYRWLYEREWRLIRESDGYVPIAPNTVTRVYFGNRIPDEVESKCIELLDNMKIPHCKMRIDGYSIEFGELSECLFTRSGKPPPH